MSDLEEFLQSADVGVEYKDDGLHIGVALAEAAHTAIEIGEWVRPVLLTEGAMVSGVIVSSAGALFAGAGPVLGMAGVFLALGSGVEAAREEIQNEAVASGFSQGFVAGILNMSGTTVSWIFGKHGAIPHNTADPEADLLEAKAYNRGLVAGYTMANLGTPEEKKAFVFEIREFTGEVPVGNWGDLEKRNYVIEYAAKLRLHFLHV